MKARLLMAALLAVSANFAFAANVCVGDGTAASAITGGSDFIQSTFTPTCSKNTFLTYAEDANQVGVCANSKKGKTDFTGNTNGQAPVAKTGVCTGASGACTQPAADKDGCS